MKILAIDTSGAFGGAALLADRQVLGERVLALQHQAAESLLPTIETLMTETRFGIADLDAIAVAVGPGSFTGVRIGMATAQGLALPNHLPVYGVSSLDALAWRSEQNEHAYAVIRHARQSEYYACAYQAAGTVNESIPEGRYAWSRLRELLHALEPVTVFCEEGAVLPPGATSEMSIREIRPHPAAVAWVALDQAPGKASPGGEGLMMKHYAENFL